MIAREELKHKSWAELIDEAYTGSVRDGDLNNFAQALYVLWQEAQNELGIAVDPYSEELEKQWVKFTEIMIRNITIRE